MFGLGAIFSAIDERDYAITKFSPQVVNKNEPVPEVTAKFRLQHIDNQEQSSTCSAYTMVNKLTVRILQRTGDYILLSPAAFYADDVRICKGEGMIGRDTMQIARKTGAIRRELFPIKHGSYKECVDLYNKNKLSYKEQSITNRIEGFVALRDAWEVAQYIQQEQVPCWGAFIVYENIRNAEKTGIIEYPSGKALGGHAVLLHDIIYIKNKPYIKFSNTWGKSWGDKGWGYLPIEMLREAWGDYDRPPLEVDNEPHEIIFFTKDFNDEMNTKVIWTDSKNLKLSDHPDAYTDGRKIFVRNGVASAYVQNRLMSIVRPLWESIGWQVDWYEEGYVILTRGKTESQFKKELGLD